MYRLVSIVLVLALALAGIACNSSDNPTTPDRRYAVHYSVTSDQPISFLEYDPGNATMQAVNPGAAAWELDLIMTEGNTVMIRGSSFDQGATVVVTAIAVSSDGDGNDFDTTDTCNDLCTATVGPIELD